MHFKFVVLFIITFGTLSFYMGHTPHLPNTEKGKSSPHSITELIPVLGIQPAGDVSHKPGSRLPLHSARPTVTPATLKSAATNFAAW